MKSTILIILFIFLFHSSIQKYNTNYSNKHTAKYTNKYTNKHSNKHRSRNMKNYLKMRKQSIKRIRQQLLNKQQDQQQNEVKPKSVISKVGDSQDMNEILGLDPDEDAKTMEEKIRNKGTFTIAYVDVNQNLKNITNNTYWEIYNKTDKQDIGENQRRIRKQYTQADNQQNDDNSDQQQTSDNEQDKSKFGGLKMSDLIIDQEIERNLYDNTNVEFPLYCRSNWNQSEELQAAKLGAQVQPCWYESYKHTDPEEQKKKKKNKLVFNKMPYLDVDDFAEFYRCIVEGDIYTIQKQKSVIKLNKNNIKVDDAIVSPADLLRIATFNDLYRKDIGWLEFWVYVCSNAKKPLDEEYFLKEKCNSFINIYPDSDLGSKMMDKLNEMQEIRRKKQKLYELDQLDKQKVEERRAKTQLLGEEEQDERFKQIDIKQDPILARFKRVILKMKYEAIRRLKIRKQYQQKIQTQQLNQQKKQRK